MNDNAVIVQEVMMRDPVTLRMCRVEIATATLYSSVIRIKVFDDAGASVSDIIDIGVRDGDVEIKRL